MMNNLNTTIYKRRQQQIQNRHKVAVFDDDSLINGSLGGVLLSFSIAATYNDDFFYKKGIDSLNKVIERLQSDSETGLYGYSFANGLTGLLTVIETLNKKFIPDASISIPGSTNKEIYNWAKEMLLQHNNDFLHGALGAIHYFAMNSQKSSNFDFLEKLTRQLLSVLKKSGVDFFLNTSNPNFPDGTVQTGIAHGQIGIYLVLMKVYNLGLFQHQIESVISNGINVLLSSYMIDDESKSLFPRIIHVDGDNEYTPKLAWCFGDLNIIYLLHSAGILFNNDQWKHAADDLSAKIAQKKCYEDLVSPIPFFCHGTAGVFQMYSKLYELTSKKCYLIEKRKWFSKTLKLVNNSYIKAMSPSLLNGYVGLALTLNEVKYNSAPFWGELFLI